MVQCGLFECNQFFPRALAIPKPWHIWISMILYEMEALPTNQFNCSAFMWFAASLITVKQIKLIDNATERKVVNTLSYVIC